MEMIIKQGDTTVIRYKGTELAFIDVGWYISLTTINGICLKNYDGADRIHQANHDAELFIKYGEIPF
jgi:hypothetical protein